MKTVLSSALTRAMREELVMRNVARLAELPAWERQPITPWTAAEARRFLNAANTDPLYPAFVLLLLYGLRRGEVLGLRWQDIDEDNQEIHIRQQIQRVKGELRLGQIKTSAGRRDLPLLPQTKDALATRRDTQTADHIALGRAWQDTGLIFITRTGRPIEPRNLVRSFHRICDANGLRTIKVHHLRHTTATLLKGRGVASDATFREKYEDTRPALQLPRRSQRAGGSASKVAMTCDAISRLHQPKECCIHFCCIQRPA